jgi:uncharacterized membrane protein
MAGEPETLDSDEPLVRKVRRHNYDRLLMLSDGVFAIAITLLVLDVRPPQQWNGDLVELVRQAWRALFGYVFGFLAVGGFWVAHRGMFARIRHIDGPATVLSLALLLFVGLVPAAAALVSEHGPTKGIPAYLLLVATIAAVQATLWIYAAFVGDLVDEALPARDRHIRTVILLIPFVIFILLFVMGMEMLSTWGVVPLVLVAIGARLLRRKLTVR